MPNRRQPPTAPRTITGFHGCSRQAAEQILAEKQFLPSTRAYDWLGQGIYFWEYAPYRALDWAMYRCSREGGEPAVIQASIRLGRCLNLLDITAMNELAETHQTLVRAIGTDRMPRNTERGAHYLDCMVIDSYCRAVEEETTKEIQSVRGTFSEGETIYAGSKILRKSHTQIAVRDPACILRVSLVEFS